MAAELQLDVGRASKRIAATSALMFASGIAGLAYQVLWVQQTSLWIGTESAAISAVVAAFFSGLSIGSFLAARVAENSPRPTYWYAALELVIAAWSITLLFALEPAAAQIAHLLGPEPHPREHWALAFVGCFLLLLPATVAMGATLPVMDRSLQALIRESRPTTPAFGWLYAANTAGALTGVLACAFWAIPTLGLARTTLCCALVNVACAILALRLPLASAPRISHGPGHSPPLAPATARSLVWLLFVTGLLAIATEYAIVRLLTQLAENTVYTFAILLAVYLAGTSAGAAWAARRPRLVSDGETGSATLASSVGGLAGALAISMIVTTMLAARGNDGHRWLGDHLPHGAIGAFGAETILAITAFLPATFLMGCTFTRLVGLATLARMSTGRTVGINVLGASLGAPLVSLLLVPTIGLRAALLLIAAAYCAIAMGLRPRARLTWFSLATAGAAAVLVPPLDLTSVPEGGKLIAQLQGRMATVAVVEDVAGARTLHIDNRQQEGSSTTTYADSRQALLPLLLHPAPRRALFLGVGTGVTAAAATLDPDLRVEAVEIVPEVLQLLPWFATAIPAGAHPAHLRLVSADARRFVRESRDVWDLIVADNFHPARSGTAALYTREHFRRVMSRLASGGFFVQWLPLHQLDLESLASIVRSFTDAAPQAFAVLANYGLDTPVLGLVGASGPLPTRATVRARTLALARSGVDRFGFHDELAVLGAVIAGKESLIRFSTFAPANTEDLPFVAYRAPYEVYASRSTPRERLMSVLTDFRTHPERAVGRDPDDAAWSDRLSGYQAARDDYLAIGMTAQPLASASDMLRQVGNPLLDVLRLSPDFRPAYDPLVRMADALAHEDTAAARRLLQALSEIQPRRPEANELLQRLSAAAGRSTSRPSP